MKRLLLIVAGLVLVLIGIFVIYLTYSQTFYRLPPDKPEPVISFDWENSFLKFSQSGNNQDTKSESSSKKRTFRLKKAFRLIIPAINLDEIVYEGVSRRVLMSGPGHLTSSSFPGEKGNCVVSGHRVTFGGPFRRLNLLKVGDEVKVQDKKKTYIYKVIWIKRVKPSETWVAAPTEIPSLTLTTCDPPYSAKYRLVVRAIMVEK